MKSPLDRVRKLGGKYYGTDVRVDGGGGVSVWVTGNGEPSNRQLKYWGVASQSEAAEEGYFCDSHYETEYGYRLAVAIAEWAEAHPVGEDK